LCSLAAAPEAVSASQPERDGDDAVNTAASLRPSRLRKRAEFLRTAKGVKWVAPAFVLQAVRRKPADQAGPRIGFTASRKVGGAVDRNLARRRLKAATGEVFGEKSRPGVDYVVIARRTTGKHDFQLILQDLDRALHMVHKRLDAPRHPHRAATSKSTAAVRPAPMKQPGP